MNEQMESIAEQVLDNIDIVLSKFHLEFNTFPNRISGCCPIHGGDNATAFNLFLDGGNWKCFTHNCELDYGNNIFGLIIGLLSVQKGERVSFADALNWLKTIITIDVKNVELTADQRQKRKFSQLTNVLLKDRNTKIQEQIGKEKVRGGLNIPAQYYINRGFTAEILNKYDVGFCNQMGKPMFGRVVIPFYDDDYKYMVGCIGRSTNPQCNICGLYHYANRLCPSNNLERLWAAKWRNSKNFDSRSYLFNYWFARPHILKSKIAILVEGQGDVLRLEESKIRIGLGLSKCALSDEQAIILERSGAEHVVLALDNDEAGQSAVKDIENKLGRCYNVHKINFGDNKDIGEMPVEQVRDIFIPFLRKLL